MRRKPFALRVVGIAGAALLGWGALSVLRHYSARNAIAESKVPHRPLRSGADVDLLAGLGVAALGERLAGEELDRVVDRVRRGDSTVDAFVDSLVADPRTAQHAYDVIFDRLEATPTTRSNRSVLRVNKTGGKDVLSLGAPCAATDTEEVHPWWDLRSTVTVCKDSVHADRLSEPESGNYCGAETGDVSYCGCGPNLVFCLRDEEQRREVDAAQVAEVRDTVAAIVGSGGSMREIFSGNASVRSMDVEMRYRRDRILAGEPADRALAGLETWDQTEKQGLRPRHEVIPGQHAGVLTMPFVAFNMKGPRLRIQVYSELLWCVVPKSRNVTASSLLSLHSPNFRTGENWRELAERPVCSECHARLDYGMRFFAGYSWLHHSFDFVAAEHSPEDGKLYIDGPDDLRAHAPASPHAFAELATREPEFGKCMAQTVLRSVLGDAATDEDQEAVLSAYKTKGDYRSMLSAALRARVTHAGGPADRVATAPTGGAATTLTAAEIPGERVSLKGKLREMVNDRCLTCHDQAPRDFRGQDEPRELGSKMLRAVASHDMPKNTEMPTRERELFVTLLATASYPNPAERAEAIRYYSQGLRALPVYQTPTLNGVLDVGDSVTYVGPNASDSTDSVRQYTPGYALGSALIALSTCNSGRHRTFWDPEADTLEDCVTELTRAPWLMPAPE
jgi:hypothetical protein